MAPALLSADPPLLPPGWHQHLPALPARTHTVIVSAMPSWQITLITVGVALLAGALAAGSRAGPLWLHEEIHLV